MYYLRRFDPWRSPLCTCPPKYSLQPYTGCSHRCLYCYATAYIGVRDSEPKREFIKRLRADLRKADPRLPVSMSNSSDPYPPLEAELRVTRRALEELVSHGFRVLIVTKSDLVLRDIDVIRGRPVSVSITITTLDDSLARRMEPGAPPPSRRVRAVAKLTEEGVPVSVRIDPIVPGLNDDPHELRELVAEVAAAGAKHVVTSTFKARPDSLARMSAVFPDLADRWRRLYKVEGERNRGYYYLRRALRVAILWPVVEEARRRGLTYATCREGLQDPKFFRAPTCDGTHLIPC